MAPTPQQYVDEINKLLDAESKKIAAESTLEDSLIAFKDATVAANVALQAEVDRLLVENAVDPATVDQVRAVFQANADALDANAAKLTAAVPQNVP